MKRARGREGEKGEIRNHPHIEIKCNRNFTEVTHNGRRMNPSRSEDSVAETTVAKKNSDGKFTVRPAVKVADLEWPKVSPNPS